MSAETLLIVILGAVLVLVILVLAGLVLSARAYTQLVEVVRYTIGLVMHLHGMPPSELTLPNGKRVKPKVPGIPELPDVVNGAGQGPP